MKFWRNPWVQSLALAVPVSLAVAAWAIKIADPAQQQAASVVGGTVGGIICWYLVVRGRV